MFDATVKRRFSGIRVLSYWDLKRFWVRGLRNGNVRRLTRVQRALYRACLRYARLVGGIVNRFLVGQLRELVDVLVSTPKVRALRAGLERVRGILSSRVVDWAPQVRDWVRDKSFILYLGFTWIGSLNYFEPLSG